jgi:hypothetical protein
MPTSEDSATTSRAPLTQSAPGAPNLRTAAFGWLPPGGLRIVFVLYFLGTLLETIVAVALRGAATEQVVAGCERVGAWCTVFAALTAVAYTAIGAYQLLRMDDGGLIARTIAATTLLLATVLVGTGLGNTLPPLIVLAVQLLVSVGAIACVVLATRSLHTRVYAFTLAGWMLVSALRSIGWILAMRNSARGGSADDQLECLFGDAIVILEALLVVAFILWLLTRGGPAGKLGAYGATASAIVLAIVLLRSASTSTHASMLTQVVRTLSSGTVHAALNPVDRFLTLLAFGLALALFAQFRQLPELTIGLALLLVARAHWDMPIAALMAALASVALAHAAISRPSMWVQLAALRPPSAPVGQPTHGD